MSILASTVVCTHNRAEYLARALRSLLAQTLPPDGHEIVVVDNCSTDTTRQVVETFAGTANVRYVYEATLGLSHARNTGWRAARGRYVAYLDDDAVAAPDWLATIVHVFETVVPRPGCVGGRIEPIWEAARPVWLSDALITALPVLDWSDTPHRLDDLAREWLAGTNIAFPVEVLARVGGFVPGLDRIGKNLLSGGDVFLQGQITRAGYSCFYHPAVCVQHHVVEARLSKRWFRRRYYWQGMSDAIMQRLQDRGASRLQRLRLAAAKAEGLVRSPHTLRSLLLPTDDPQRFTQKCFALITLGQIRGLLLASEPCP